MIPLDLDAMVAAAHRLLAAHGLTVDGAGDNDRIISPAITSARDVLALAAALRTERAAREAAEAHHAALAGEVRAVTRVLLTSSWMAVAALALRDDISTAPTIHPPRTSAPTFSDATPCDATLTIDTSAAPAWPTQPVRLNRCERRARRFAR